VKKQTYTLKPTAGINNLQVCNRFSNLFGGSNFTGDTENN